MVNRFAPNQGKVSKCIKHLISIYSLISRQRSNESSWGDNDKGTQKIIHAIRDIIDEIYGGTCTSVFNREENRYDLKYSFSEGRHQTGNEESRVLRVSRKDLARFAALMRNLVDEIKGDKKTSHIRLEGVADELKTTLDSGDSSNYLWQNVSLMNKTIVDTFKEKVSHKRIEDGSRIVAVFFSRRLRIKHLTPFGKSLFNPHHGSVVRAFLLNDPDIRTFRRLARYIIIYFHLEFNGFSRLKICECCKEKIFFEQSSGVRRYCSDTCRQKAFHQNREEEWKFKCRNRQNAWIRNKSSRVEERVYMLGQDKCNDCREDSLRSGECKGLRDLNNKIDFSKLMGRKRSENIVRRPAI